MTRCQGQGCTGWTRVQGTLCERCQRLTAIGHLVLVAVLSENINTTQWWNAMDAVAHLLLDHAELRRRHRREMSQEIQDGSRAVFVRDTGRNGRQEQGVSTWTRTIPGRWRRC